MPAAASWCWASPAAGWQPRALAAGGSDVAVWDDRPANREAAAAAGFAIADPAGEDWSQVAALVMSPGCR